MNEASGNQVWSWQPPQGTVQIIAATAGGGVAVMNIVGNQEDVVRLDSSANATYDTWGTAGGSAGYGVVSNSTHFANNLWFGTTGDPVIAGVIGDTESDAPDVYADHGGTPQNQGSSSPGFVLVATQDCDKYSPPSKLYARYPIYSLRLDNIQQLQCNQGQPQCYTVFESVMDSNSYNTSTCNGKFTSISPCQYGDGSALNPYNEFDDEIVSPFKPFDRLQRFLYGLPNHRLYGIGAIYRTLPDGSVQLKQPNTSFNHLQATPGTDPLIDGNLDPWLAPWNHSPDTCNSSNSRYFGQ